MANYLLCAELFALLQVDSTYLWFMYAFPLDELNMAKVDLSVYLALFNLRSNQGSLKLDISNHFDMDSNIPLISISGRFINLQIVQVLMELFKTYVKQTYINISLGFYVYTS